jgi:TolB protein
VKNRFLLSLILLAIPGVSFQALNAQDEVYLKIQSEGFRKINLVVAPFKTEGQIGLTKQIREVMINDLTLSGFFQIFDESKNDLSSGKGDQTGELQSGARIEGHLKYHGDEIQMNALLSELPGMRKIFDKKFNAPTRSLRSIAHQVSDEIVYYLIGEKGIASTKIAFISEKAQAKEIAVIDYDGNGFQQLTASNSLNVSPRWSPDGEKIAFTSFIMENPDLLILPVGDKKAYRLSNQPGLNTAPAWSPDGKRMALTMTKDGNPEVYVMEIKGAKTQRLTNHPAIDSSPSWSPDGREIAFTSDRSGAPQIYLMDSEGGNIRRLTFEGSYNDSPGWSPRGDRIAFVSRYEGKFHIYTIHVTGQELLKLTDGAGNNENPCWSPDGLRLAFASNREGKWDIYVMNWDGSQLRKVTRTGGNISPSWSPRLKFD